MTRRAVIVGGFTTGQRLLEPLAEATCNHFGFDDAEIFTFTDVITSPHRLEQASRQQSVIAHSAGLLAVAKCSGMERVFALNAPEPMAASRLVVRAAVKTAQLYKTVVTGPNRAGAAGVVLSNAQEGLVHPVAHAKQIVAVSKFSGRQQLSHMEDAGVAVSWVNTSADEFFGPHSAYSWDGQSAVLAGCHDQVLIDPAGFMDQLPREALSD